MSSIRVAAIAVLALAAHGVAAQELRVLPFSQEENADGARFAWFLQSRMGHRYRYVPADSIPESERFRALSEPQAGDLVWWPRYVAIYDGAGLSTDMGRVPLDSAVAVRGEPRFFRFVPLDPDRPSRQATPYRLLRGRVEFAVPNSWRLIDIEDNAAVQHATFHIPNPATDTVSPHRANVLITVRALEDRPDFWEFTETQFRGSVRGEDAAIASDDYTPGETRVILWRSELRGAPYLIFDLFATEQDLYLSARLIEPLAETTPRAWSDEYWADLNAVIDELTLDGNEVLREAFQAQSVLVKP